MKRSGITVLLIFLVTLGFGLKAQEAVNRIDSKGMKQGPWKKLFENGNILYEGTFKDNKPVGEFKRYYNTGQLISVLNHRFENDTTEACFFYSNGFKAAEGIYFGKQKTGIWKFYSEKQSGTVICIESYVDNKKEGLSTKYHLNGNKAEILHYSGNIKEGDWTQYYTDEIICIKSQYKRGKLDGKFETWYPHGEKEIIGQYSNDIRNGKWSFYNKDGSFKRNIIYRNGIAENNAELIKEQTDYLDKLEREGGKIKDPAKTKVIW